MAYPIQIFGHNAWNSGACRSIRRFTGHLFFAWGPPSDGRQTAVCGRSTSTSSTTFRLSCWLSQWISLKVFQRQHDSPSRPPNPTERGTKHQNCTGVSSHIGIINNNSFILHFPASFWRLQTSNTTARARLRRDYNNDNNYNHRTRHTTTGQRPTNHRFIVARER